MKELTVLLAGAFLVSGLWTFMFRVVFWHDHDDHDKKRTEALKAAKYVMASCLTIIIGSYLDLTSLENKSILVISIIGILFATGLIINVARVPPNPETKNEKRLSRKTILMMSSVVWIGIPFLAFVIIPATGIELWIGLAITGILAWLSPLIDIL